MDIKIKKCNPTCFLRLSLTHTYILHMHIGRFRTLHTCSYMISKPWSPAHGTNIQSHITQADPHKGQQREQFPVAIKLHSKLQPDFKLVFCCVLELAVCVAGALKAHRSFSVHPGDGYYYTVCLLGSIVVTIGCVFFYLTTVHQR